jgi:hypothetical protein
MQEEDGPSTQRSPPGKRGETVSGNIPYHESSSHTPPEKSMPRAEGLVVKVVAKGTPMAFVCVLELTEHVYVSPKVMRRRHLRSYPRGERGGGGGASVP